MASQQESRFKVKWSCLVRLKEIDEKEACKKRDQPNK